ncbi:hypothetical protein DL96DRAFT_1757199 [Flagelloscypha sp. PMI_526]|nr:hypothetical protein DL96DRAFT_1757199 [Flagelloscypha sp. PMI_526]
MTMSTAQTTRNLKKMLHEARTSPQGLEILAKDWPTNAEQFLHMGILKFFFELLPSDAIPWDIHPDDVPVPHMDNSNADLVVSRAQTAFFCLGRLHAKYHHQNHLPNGFCSEVMAGWPSLLGWSTFFLNLTGIPKLKFRRIFSLIALTWAVLMNSNREYFIPEVNNVPGAFELYSRIWLSAIDDPNEDGLITSLYLSLCSARSDCGHNPALDFFQATRTTPSSASFVILSKCLIPQDLRHPILLDMKFSILVTFAKSSVEFNNSLVKHGIVLKSVEFLKMIGDPSAFSDANSVRFIFNSLLRGLTAWIRAGDGTTWMKRALQAGLIRSTLYSAQFFGEYFQDIAPSVEILITTPLLYCSHPHIQPLIDEAYGSARHCCDDLPPRFNKDRILGTFIYAEEVAKIPATLNDCTLTQAKLRCNNNDMPSYAFAQNVSLLNIAVVYVKNATGKFTATETPALRLIHKDRLIQCSKTIEFIRRSEETLKILDDWKLVPDADPAVIVAIYNDIPATPSLEFVPFRVSDLAKAYGFHGNPADFNWQCPSVVYDPQIFDDLSTRIVHVDLLFSRDSGKHAMRTHIVIGLDKLVQEN